MFEKVENACVEIICKDPVSLFLQDSRYRNISLNSLKTICEKLVSHKPYCQPNSILRAIDSWSENNNEIDKNEEISALAESINTKRTKYISFKSKSNALEHHSLTSVVCLRVLKPCVLFGYGGNRSNIEQVIIEINYGNQNIQRSAKYLKITNTKNYKHPFDNFISKIKLNKNEIVKFTLTFKTKAMCYNYKLRDNEYFVTEGDQQVFFDYLIFEDL